MAIFEIMCLLPSLSAKSSEGNLLDKRSVDDRHWCHMTVKRVVLVDSGHEKLSTL